MQGQIFIRDNIPLDKNFSRLATELAQRR
jgi:hypothetical protein